jgi:CDP-paratose 2-epimerase
VALLDELNGGSPRIVFGAERPGDQRWYVTDTSRFRQATGWAPTVKARDGVESLYSWLGRRAVSDELLATV